MASAGKAKDTSLRTGFAVPDSGIYRVCHSQHNLPLEVTLLKDQKFPRCSRCKEPVFYELLRSAPAVTSSHPSAFLVELYELPELLPDDEVAS
jgi:hypothetical protein